MFVQNESFDKYFKDMESDFISQFKSVENVNYLDKSYRNADSNSRKLADRMIERLLKSGSTIVGIQNILELYEKAKSGKSSIILMEHYSNFDFPCFQFLLYKMGYHEVADHIIPIAGVKLFRDNLFVKTLSLGYNAILVYPPHAFVGVGLEHARQRRVFNANSMKYIYEKKNSGYIILIFPTATRYRKGKPETKKIIFEIGNYFKIFDYYLMIGVNGNVLEVSEDGDMSHDVFKRDSLIYNADKVISIAEYRDEILSALKDCQTEITKEVLGLKIAEDLENRFNVLHAEGLEVYKKSFG
ncbi:1-acyl-sn-glycerol-3-phosphate acyltransferase [Borreliella garinii]|nr:1-acyl-sn-glycerol-3-phosphate acyltransferase [Borreliella garinii]